LSVIQRRAARSGRQRRRCPWAGQSRVRL